MNDSTSRGRIGQSTLAKHSAAAMALGLVLLFTSSPSSAGPGDLDPTFGIGGVVTTPIGASHDESRDVLVQPDGKIVACGNSWFDLVRSGGDASLVRYLPDGTLDLAFGVGGIVTQDMGGGANTWDAYFDAVLLPDGRLIAVGAANSKEFQSDILVARYNPDGTLDNTFGTAGLVVTDLGGREWALAVAVSPDGKIVVSGRGPNDWGSSFIVVRYQANGVLDSSFGTNGVARTPFPVGNAEIQDIVIQPDGKIVAAGYTGTSGGGWDWAVARYNVDGSLDPAFGSNGTVITDLGLDSATTNWGDWATAVMLQADGKVLVGGVAGVNGPLYNSIVAVARYDSSGNLDPFFGSVGWALIDGAAVHSPTVGGVLQSNGQIVVAYNEQESDTLLHAKAARLLGNGSLDPSFGRSGIATTSTASVSWNGPAVAATADDKLVVFSSQFNGTDDDFAVARLLGPGACGDGTLNPGEQCDDGNTLDGDCCSSTCQFEALGSPCADGEGRAWVRSGYDLARTHYYPYGSSVQAAFSDFKLAWSAPGVTNAVLTGDINGDGALEVVTYHHAARLLRAYNKNGGLLWETSSGGLPYAAPLLADVTGNGALEVLNGVKAPDGTLHIDVYDGSGALLKSIVRPGGWGSMMIRPFYAGDIDGDGDKEILAVIGADYAGEPRGTALFDYTTGSELWYYDVGSHGNALAAGDIDEDGDLEVIKDSASVHNGAWGCGVNGQATCTSDTEVATTAVDVATGDEVFTRFYGHGHGFISHAIADLSGNGDSMVVGIWGHDAAYYPGPFQIFTLDNAGSTLSIWNGPSNRSSGNWAIADVDGDARREVITQDCLSTPSQSDCRLRVIDDDLGSEVAVSAPVGTSWSEMGVCVADVDGDGLEEILYTDHDGGVVRLFDGRLQEVWSFSVPGVLQIALTDLDGDGVVELLTAGDSLTVLSTSGPVCGNGVIDPGEQCDDGNVLDGDCCSSMCQFEAGGSSCADGDLCNGDETCDGAGICTPGAPLECDDDNLCTQDSCDGDIGCINAGTPIAGCLTARKVSFKVEIDPRIARSSDDEDDGDSDNELSWKWRRGEAVADDDLGDPLTDTTYALCVYDSTTGVPSLVGSLHVDPNGAWRDREEKGWSYKDKTAMFDGVTKIKLRSGKAGKSKAELKAGGINFTPPLRFSAEEYFDQDPDVTVQLVNSEGVCWTSRFGSSKKNSPSEFEAKCRGAACSPLLP